MRVITVFIDEGQPGEHGNIVLCMSMRVASQTLEKFDPPSQKLSPATRQTHFDKSLLVGEGFVFRSATSLSLLAGFASQQPSGELA